MPLSPYFRLMRLHQPVGIWLLLWPCWWSIALASAGAPSRELLLLFALGAVVMRSAGCIINDLWDRDFDKAVERTKTRPLASGEVAPRQALILLGILLAIALAVAVALGAKVVLWAAASLPLVALYPAMKRITWWPQLFLGATFNWGALLGWVSVRGEINLPALWLYLAGIFWTLGYDTIYAHQDKRDDARIGVKSTALKLGAYTKPFLCVFYGLMLIFLTLAGKAAWEQNDYYWLIPYLFAPHLIWQISYLDLNDPASCLRKFKSNITLGSLIFLFFLLVSFSFTSPGAP